MNFLVDENDSVDTRSNPPSPRTCDSRSEVTLRTPLEEPSPPSGRETFTRMLRTCDSPREVTFRTGLRESPPKEVSETIEDALKRCYQK